MSGRKHEIKNFTFPLRCTDPTLRTLVLWFSLQIGQWCFLRACVCVFRPIDDSVG